MSSYHPADCALLIGLNDRIGRRSRVLFVKPARWTLLCLFTGESGTKIVHAYFPLTIRTVSTLQFPTVFEQATCKQIVTYHQSIVHAGLKSKALPSIAQ